MRTNPQVPVSRPSTKPVCSGGRGGGGGRKELKSGGRGGGSWNGSLSDGV